MPSGEIRRVCGKLGWGLTIYYGIITLSVLMLSEIGYFLAAAVGSTALLLWKKGELSFDRILQKGKPMTGGSLFRICSVFISLQLVYSIFSALWIWLWKRLGMEYTSAISLDMDSWSVFLYVSLVAPVTEELLFRGVILRSLQPFGKQFAILASAILFSAFHGNLLQGIFAFGMGVVLGYVAVEYHFLWSVVLHIFNNFILADLLPRISRWLGVGEALVWIVVLCASVAAVLVLIRRGEMLARYLWRGINTPSCWRGFFTATGTVMFLILMTLSAVLVEWISLQL